MKATIKQATANNNDVEIYLARYLLLQHTSL
jgi:hypothetical protein